MQILTIKILTKKQSICSALQHSTSFYFILLLYQATDFIPIASLKAYCGVQSNSFLFFTIIGYLKSCPALSSVNSIAFSSLAKISVLIYKGQIRHLSTGRNIINMTCFSMSDDFINSNTMIQHI